MPAVATFLLVITSFLVQSYLSGHSPSLVPEATIVKMEQWVATQKADSTSYEPVAPKTNPSDIPEEASATTEEGFSIRLGLVLSDAMKERINERLKTNFKIYPFSWPGS